MRQFTFIDKIIDNVDAAIQTLTPPKQRSVQRAYPDEGIDETELTQSQKRHIAGLMRVNHSGEVCAQALYQGQAMTAQLTEVRDKMNQAAAEEIEHLAWCEKRLEELSSAPSLLNPLWYTGSLTIGAIAGLIGDKWSLGFVVETERQVTTHLASHIAQLPKEDIKTLAVLEQMKQDETEHAETAYAAGGAELPDGVRWLMKQISKIMTNTSYYL